MQAWQEDLTIRRTFPLNDSASGRSERKRSVMWFWPGETHHGTRLLTRQKHIRNMHRNSSRVVARLFSTDGFCFRGFAPYSMGHMTKQPAAAAHGGSEGA